MEEINITRMWLRVQELCGTTNTDKYSRITLIKKLWGDCRAWTDVSQIWPTSFLRPVCMCARVCLCVCVSERSLLLFFFFFPTDSAVRFGISAVFAFAIVSPPASFVFPAFRTQAQLCVCISCVQLSVFIYYAVWKPQKQWVTLDVGIWNSPLTYQPDQREQAWRFASYMFVHAGWAAHACGRSSSHFSRSLRLLRSTNRCVIWVFWLNPLFFRTFRLADLCYSLSHLE